MRFKIQHGPEDCGPIAAANILKTLGLPAPELAQLKRFCETSRGLVGTNIYKLIEALEFFNLRVTSHGRAKIHTIHKLLADPHTAGFALFDPIETAGRHFAAICQVIPNKCVIAPNIIPGCDKHQVTWRKFSKHYLTSNGILKGRYFHVRRS